jgi:predicted HicB family RNase H-like nuclease
MMSNSTTLTTRVSPEFKLECQKQADNFGISLSEWVLRACGGTPIKHVKSVSEHVVLAISLPLHYKQMWKRQAIAHDLSLSQWVINQLETSDEIKPMHTFYEGRRVDVNEVVMLGDREGIVLYQPKVKQRNRWSIGFKDMSSTSQCVPKPSAGILIHPDRSDHLARITMSVPYTLKDSWNDRANIEGMKLSKWIIAMIGEFK